ncbi:unnamed protein product [Rotaria sordida]|uniref:RBR-type E3 ubiquitin transferase n=1 Tax=Rotaria sordida TaxID=392033 RepID=A0A814URS8_9BILA|nr:unnamed protein product [Rotaria sordida]
MVTTRLKIIILLILSLLSNIILELIFNSILNFYPKITLLEHIQSSLTLIRLIGIICIGLICFILLFGTLIMISDDGIFYIYITFLKFFEFILPLIDIINLFLIYQYKIECFNKENSCKIGIEIKKTMHYPSIRFVLSLIFALIRLIINIDIVRRKCDYKWKRKIIILFDLLLFILVNISLIRYLTKNLFRIGRKIILPILIYQLNNLFLNETFWIDSFKLNELIKRKFNSMFFMKSILSTFYSFTDKEEYILLKINHLILSIRWIISSCILYLFIGYIFNWDTLQNKTALDQYGIFYMCIGFDLLPGIKTTDIFSHSQIKTKNVVAENTRSPSILIKKEQQTCAVCYEDKDSNEFDGLLTTNCQHLNRSLCNSCLFRHVQQVFQITFTDDIYCPEYNCNVKLDYDIVKNILLSNGDNKLVERYDRYIFHRQLEQMDEFIWCSNILCNVGQLNEGGALNNIVTCFNCHQKTCFTHKIKWHEGLSCEEFDMRMDPIYESSRRWIVENSKKCPNCPYQIEKNDGCDHMTCIKCRHEFCWSCLADFQPIRRNGNHRHNSTCKHYVPYNRQ